jgi:hypothetical protein
MLIEENKFILDLSVLNDFNLKYKFIVTSIFCDLITITYG